MTTGLICRCHAGVACHVIIKEVGMELEYRICNVCGESWVDRGDLKCPFCRSGDIDSVYDEEEEYER